MSKCEEFKAASAKFEDVDLDRICQALLLHRSLGLPLRDKGCDALRLCWENSDFKRRLLKALERLSTQSKLGIQVMSESQGLLVRELIEIDDAAHQAAILAEQHTRVFA